MTADRVARYVFGETWRIAAPADRVYEVLADPAAYPSWWPQVRSVVRITEDAGVMRCRSRLPYDLVITGRREVEDPVGRVLRARLEGDLSGWSGWRISTTGDDTVAVFEQDVVVRKPSLLAFGRLARPVLTYNHAVMMRSGERNLQRYLNELAARVAPRPTADVALAD